MEYVCKDCGSELKTAWGLKLHERRHSGSDQYICMLQQTILLKAKSWQAYVSLRVINIIVCNNSVILNKCNSVFCNNNFIQNCGLVNVYRYKQLFASMRFKNEKTFVVTRIRTRELDFVNIYSLRYTCNPMSLVLWWKISY